MGEFHALLVEGVPGVGKSTLIDALIRRHVDSSDPRRIRSFLHLSQTHTYGPLAPAEDRRSLTMEENLELLGRIAQTLEWLHADLRHSDKPCFILIDSLHLTHCLRPGVLAWEDATPIDRRLAEIGCKLLLLTGKPETIRSRTIHARADSQFLTQYATKFGQTLEMIHAHFVREQTEFIRMFGESALEKRMFENDGSLDTIVEDAHRFWTAEPGASGVRFKTHNA
ncbi:MAG TPA: hypothetical protein VEJ38_16300 [Candidatus Acidoferrales bacterium]|nr:hypothetical protein [Candidatus Acidoferrales bacterium]